MINDSIAKLIAEMQEVKAEYPTLEIADVLRIFTIDATNKLANEMSRGFK